MGHSGFFQKKFLSLPVSQQHKKCAELLRKIYTDYPEDIDSKIAHYNEIQQWMNMPSLPLNDSFSLSDRYHDHLKQARVSLREHNLLPHVRHHDRTATKCAPLPISIYLDHIRSAHNVGSIIRTVEGFSLGSLYFSPQTPFIDHKQVKDTSMGAFEWVECDNDTELAMLPRPIIALETSDIAIPLHDFLFPKVFTLVIGNEEYGCSPEALKKADYIVHIPMLGRKNSLNVANAFAIAAAEIRRQQPGKEALTHS